MGKRPSEIESLETAMQARLDHLESETNARIESLGRKLQVLEALERKLAQAVTQMLPAPEDKVEGYDVQTIHTNTGPRYVWKHFMRGARSVKSFDTREACLKNAKDDALKHIAYPSQDLSTMINSIAKEKPGARPVRPAPPLADGIRPGRDPKSVRRI